MAWHWAIEVLQLDDSQPLGIGFHVYRMPPGMTTRGHRHNGHEQFLILEGELHESDGTILRAGDMVFYRDGTEHNSYTPNGCLLAVHIAGPEILRSTDLCAIAFITSERQSVRVQNSGSGWRTRQRLQRHRG